MSCQHFRVRRGFGKGHYLVLLVASFSLILSSTARAQLGDDTSVGRYLRTSPKVLAAFRKVVAEPSQSTVRIRCAGKNVALGTVVGAKGWIGVRLDEAVDWRETEAFVRRSYRLVAPKRLAKLVA